MIESTRLPHTGPHWRGVKAAITFLFCVIVDDETIHNQVPYQDCVVDSLSLFESKDCNSKFGFTCSLNNGKSIGCSKKSNKVAHFL